MCRIGEFGPSRFEEAAKVSAELGLAGLEIGTGNWNAAPHANLQSLLESAEERRKFLSVFERNGLVLSALNCNGNQLHPVDGERQSKVVYDTLRVAELLGVKTIVLMSGLPAGGPKDSVPTGSLARGTGRIWRFSIGNGTKNYSPIGRSWRRRREMRVCRLCVELHGHQLVYNVPTLLKLRKEVGTSRRYQSRSEPSLLDGRGSACGNRRSSGKPSIMSTRRTRL